MLYFTLKKAALVCCLLCGVPAAAQDEIIVPRAGIYDHRAPATNVMYEARDAGPSLIKLSVEECGTVLTLSFPDGEFSVVYDEGKNNWSGQVAPNGPVVSIEPQTETEFTSWMAFGTMREPAYSTYNAELSAAEVNTSGTYGGIELKDTKLRTEGVYQVETRIYAIRLLNFRRYKSSLRPEHEAILAQALGLFSERDDAEGMCFKRTVRLGEDPVEGYAEDRFERRKSYLAKDRAETVASYLSEKTGARNVEAAAGGESFAPYRAQFCGRAAIATIEVEQEYLIPYTRRQTDEWLKDDLRSIKATFSDGNEGEVERLRAKSRYCLSNALLDALEDGHCPEAEFLGGIGDKPVSVDQPIEVYALRGIPSGSRENLSYLTSPLPSLIKMGWDKLEARTRAEGGIIAGYVRESSGEYAAQEYEQNTQHLGHPYIMTCGRSARTAKHNRDSADRIEADIFDGTAIPWVPLHADPTKEDYYEE